jgi:hypothetical protein
MRTAMTAARVTERLNANYGLVVVEGGANLVDAGAVGAD